jgi:hypothetical protein
MGDEIYKTGRIYYLCSDKTDDIYIGSTKRSLYRRLSGHKAAYRKFLRGKYNRNTSFDICKYDDCRIYEIEKFNNISKKDLEFIEGNYILNCDCVNKVCVGRTPEEYREVNRGKINERGRDYYKLNKEMIKEKTKEYYNINKDKFIEKGKEYYEKNKEKKLKYQKEYNENHKENKREYDKEYRKKYNEKNKVKRLEKHNCICGGKFVTQNKIQHEKSLKHQNFINNQ